MPKIIIMICIISLGIIFAIWDSLAPPTNITKTTAQTLNPAPNPRFSDIYGKSYNLHQFKGKTIVLNFWATWCAPCVVEFPQLLELAKREQNSIVLITLSVDEDPKNIERFFKKLPSNIQNHLKLDNVIIGLDTDKTISRDMFKTIRYPETFIINKDMMIRTKIEGIIDWLDNDIKYLLE